MSDHYSKQREQADSEKLLDICHLCGQQSNDLINNQCHDCIAEQEHGSLFDEMDSIIKEITFL